MRKTLIRVCFPVIAALMIGACAPIAANTSSTTATQSTAAVTSLAVTEQATATTATSEQTAASTSAAVTVTSAAAAQDTAASTQQAAATDTTAPSAPPSDAAGGAPPGGGSTDAATGLASATGAYTLDGGTAAEENKTYTATNEDQSGVYVTNGGVLTLTNPTIVTSGNTSSQDNSSFYGLNAGVLASGGSTVTIAGGTISTTGTGANGAFAQGAGTSVTLTDVTIDAKGDGGHGVMATNGGVITLTNVDMTTAGKNSGVIATDRGSGTITVTGGTVIASGQDSPAIYSTGAITVSNATLTASGAEAAVIEGANSITLEDSDLSSTLEGKWGVMIYQSMSGDAEGTQGVFTMTGGSLAYTSTTGPLFYVNNSTGVITLKDVEVTAASGILIDASANSRWGTSGANGGTVIFTADGQTLVGDMTADAISSITATLRNGSSLAGSINAGNTAKAANLTLDATSIWTVTADSHLTCLTLEAGILGDTISNITGNGHTVYYDASACPGLGGQTYTLNGGGALTPAS